MRADPVDVRDAQHIQDALNKHAGAKRASARIQRTDDENALHRAGERRQEQYMRVILFPRREKEAGQRRNEADEGPIRTAKAEGRRGEHDFQHRI